MDQLQKWCTHYLQLAMCFGLRDVFWAGTGPSADSLRGGGSGPDVVRGGHSGRRAGGRRGGQPERPRHKAQLADRRRARGKHSCQGDHTERPADEPDNGQPAAHVGEQPSARPRKQQIDRLARPPAVMDLSSNHQVGAAHGLSCPRHESPNRTKLHRPYRCVYGRTAKFDCSQPIVRALSKWRPQWPV